VWKDRCLNRDSLIFCDFLSHWPTLRPVKRARRATLESYFHAHNVRRAYIVEERIQGIRAATALTQDEADIRPNQMAVQALVEQLRALLQATDRFDAEIHAVAKSLPAYDPFTALPGAGHIQSPPLLVAFGEDRNRYANAAQIQSYSGVAPLVERSGNKCWVRWRIACPTFLRQTFVEWAGSTTPRSYRAAAYYQQQRNKGCSHRVAVRALAFKWIRIPYRCWKTRTPYDESVYLNALRRRGSPLLANYSESANITCRSASGREAAGQGGNRERLFVGQSRSSNKTLLMDDSLGEPLVWLRCFPVGIRRASLKSNFSVVQRVRSNHVFGSLCRHVTARLKQQKFHTIYKFQLIANVVLHSVWNLSGRWRE
jgi:Transposase IS116/IS110/IS902 family